MKIKIPPHWAARVTALQQEVARLRQHPAVAAHNRAMDEVRSLEACLTIDAGMDPEEMESIQLTVEPDGAYLVAEKRTARRKKAKG